MKRKNSLKANNELIVFSIIYDITTFFNIQNDILYNVNIDIFYICDLFDLYINKLLNLLFHLHFKNDMAITYIIGNNESFN